MTRPGPPSSPPATTGAPRNRTGLRAPSGQRGTLSTQGEGRGRCKRAPLVTALICLFELTVTGGDGVEYQPPMNCPVGRDGQQCEYDHVPSCRVPSTGYLVPSWHVTTCACLKEWKAYAENYHFGNGAYKGFGGDGMPCFDVPAGSPVDTCWEEPQKCSRVYLDGASFEAEPWSKRNPRHLFPYEPSPIRSCVAPPPPPPPAPAHPTATPGGRRLRGEGEEEEGPPVRHSGARAREGVCGGHGACERVRVHGTLTEQSQCYCAHFRHGQYCEGWREPWPPSARGDGTYCLNNCAGHGTCQMYTCQCDPGYGGIDCSIGPGDPGTRGGRNTHTGLHKGTLRPRIYVMELPARYTTHHMWYAHGGWNMDSDRPDAWLFLEAALRSRRRTMDPKDADYFVMPVVGDPFILRQVAYEEGVKAFGERLRQRQVVWPPMMHDNGGQQYHQHGEMLRKYGTGNVFLTAHGLHEGHRWVSVPGHFRPGVDIVVPNVEYYVDPARGRHACDFFHGEQGRTQKLYFAGGINPHPQDNARHTAEAALQPLLQNRSDMVFGQWGGGGDGRISGPVAPLGAAAFCLSLHGKNGGWAQRDYMGMLEGCLPVFALANASFTFDELFPPHSYGIVVSEHKMHRLPGLVDHLMTKAGKELRQMRHEATVVCNSFLPPRGTVGRPGGSELDDDGNSFSSIMRILQKRLEKHSGGHFKGEHGETDIERLVDN